MTQLEMLHTSTQLVILGAGYLGQRTAQEALRRGLRQIVALRRRPLKIPSVDTYTLDLESSGATQELQKLFKRFTDPESPHPPKKVGILYCLSPDSFELSAYDFVYIQGLTKLLKALENAPNPDLFHVILTSSTSVYQENTGDWVDETTTDHSPPREGNARIIYEGEELLKASSVPWTILRFGGIYGPQRFSFLSRVAQGLEPLYLGKTLYTNRIHIDDGASMILFCLENSLCMGEVFNAVDCEPAARNDVVSYLWNHFGNREIPLRKTLELNEIRHRGNKRCRSDKIRSLGFNYAFPTFREGYQNTKNSEPL
jgi:nucleoside-diphosphate-sugar epimerase